MIERLKALWKKLTYKDPYEAMKRFSTANFYEVSEEELEKLEQMIEDYRRSEKE